MEKEEEKNKKREIWDQVYETNPAHTKRVETQNGRLMHYSIDAYTQIEIATNLWGPFGQDWGVNNENYKLLEYRNKVFCLYTADLYYPDGVFPIQSDIKVIIENDKYGDKYDEGFSKKVSTSALTKGLSKLGFNGDIFQGKYKDNTYVSMLRLKYGNGQPPKIEPEDNNTQGSFDNNNNKKEEKKRYFPISKEYQDKVIFAVRKTKPPITINHVVAAINKEFKEHRTEIKEISLHGYDWIRGQFLIKYGIQF